MRELFLPYFFLFEKKRETKKDGNATGQGRPMCRRKICRGSPCGAASSVSGKDTAILGVISQKNQPITPKPSKIKII
jgi:hypothetical protein